MPTLIRWYKINKERKKLQPTFKPPANEEEFKQRASQVTLQGAKSVLHSLRARQRALLQSIEEEINFYERVVALKETEALEARNRPRNGQGS